MSSPTDALSQRPKQINYQRIDGLSFIGNYTRELPVNLVRMVENAYDWEHLPCVHASSFESIECLDEGSWGWRASAVPTNSEGQSQLLELLVDRDKHYWATTIVAGPGERVEIHTQAAALGDNNITIDVRFYSKDEITEDLKPVYLDALKAQYGVLYDEDEVLMQGRQAALDQQLARRGAEAPRRTRVGAVAELDTTTVTRVETSNGSYCLYCSDGKWIAYSAICPHLLGPLEHSAPDNGIVQCPWHGYRFDIHNGNNLDGKCRGLATAPVVEIEDSVLYLCHQSEESLA